MLFNTSLDFFYDVIDDVICDCFLKINLYTDEGWMAEIFVEEIQLTHQKKLVIFYFQVWF
jgi:hypothetical protein